jgi:predicted dehydrogenase
MVDAHVPIGTAARHAGRLGTEKVSHKEANGDPMHRRASVSGTEMSSFARGDRPLRTALVGCGQIADAHLQAARHTGVATLAAVCDRSPDLARQAAVRFGVPRQYSDFDRMLDAIRPDVVHITTPPETHRALLQQAIDAGAHVYVEKPFALNVAEADEMLAIAAARDRLVCVGHDRLFDPAWLECRDRVRLGAVGRVTHVEIFQAYDLDGPFGRLLVSDDHHWVRRLPGGLFQNTLPHALATVAEIVSDPCPVVAGTSWSRAPYDFATELQVLVRGDRTTAALTFMTQPRPAASYVRVYGTAGWIEVDYEARATRLRAATELPSLITKVQAPWATAREGAATLTRNLYRLLRADLHYFAGLQQLCRLFYGAILERGHSPIDPDHIHRTSWLMDAVIDALGGRHELAVEYDAAR